MDSSMSSQVFCNSSHFSFKSHLKCTRSHCASAQKNLSRFRVNEMRPDEVPTKHRHEYVTRIKSNGVIFDEDSYKNELE